MPRISASIANGQTTILATAYRAPTFARTTKVTAPILVIRLVQEKVLVGGKQHVVPTAIHVVGGFVDADKARTAAKANGGTVLTLAGDGTNYKVTPTGR